MPPDSPRLYHPDHDQHIPRCGVPTAWQSPPQWATVAQGEVALRLHFIGLSRILALLGARTKTKDQERKIDKRGVTCQVSPLNDALPITHSNTDKYSKTVIPQVCSLLHLPH